MSIQADARTSIYNSCLIAIYYDIKISMKYINEWFTCGVCQAQIWPCDRGCRNHCPKCFSCLHVDDIIPWDRKSLCTGLMLPDYYVYHTHDIDIHFVCIKCWHTHFNKQAPDDDITHIDWWLHVYQYYIQTSQKPQFSHIAHLLRLS